ncbi:hypothetical protein [Sulfitobacter faviae]|uniref:hypothetical protein n=1 Tax=Sulfitobacter faviae TaxID=1775881 RepID=UPI0024587B86|nr:hypothetical protein [Sulfitobacter faviae]
MINFISSVSSFIMAIGLVMVLVDIIIHSFVAVRGPRNPWRAGTLEWAGMSPPASYNFASLPMVGARAPLNDTPDLANRLAKGEGYLGAPEVSRRETLMVDAASGRLEALVIYPGNTRLPILMAAVTGGFFLSILLKLFWLTRWRWPAWRHWRCSGSGNWVRGTIKAHRRWGAARPCRWQVRATDRRAGGVRPSSWWPMGPSSAHFFLAMPSSGPSRPAGLLPNGSPLLGRAWLRHRRSARRYLRPAPERPPQPRGRRPYGRSCPGISGNGCHSGGVRGLAAAPPAPDGHAYAATLLILGAYGLAHALLVGLMQGFLILQVRRGFTSPQRRAVFAIVTLWSDYLAAITVLILLAAHLPGMIA